MYVYQMLLFHWMIIHIYFNYKAFVPIPAPNCRKQIRLALTLLSPVALTSFHHMHDVMSAPLFKLFTFYVRREFIQLHDVRQTL